MNGNLSPEILAERLAEIERSARRLRSVNPRRNGSPVREAMGHALVALGTRLEGRSSLQTARLR